MDSENKEFAKKSTRGRKKGIPNRNSALLREALSDAGFHFAAEWVRLYGQLEDGDRKWNELKWLARYLHPELKAVESAQPQPADPADPIPTEHLLQAVK